LKAYAVAAIFPEPALLAAFCVASLVLALTPGPAVLYIVARTMGQGRRSGFASVAGVALGNFGNAAGAAAGLGALFAWSSTAFTVVKWAGALYLVWLGVQALRRAPAAVSPDAPPAGGHARVLREGFWVALLNPKTALFFAAFLPQFIAPGPSPLAQSLALGTLFVAIAACSDALYVLLAGSLQPLLGRARGAARVGRWLTGGTYIGLGILAALSDTRRARPGG
jgi:threonine/homoserine/homoserine lactone efflux protein